MRMDPICGEQLDALNAADCALGKTNRSQGRPPEYSSVPALQAMGPTWRLQIPLDLFVAPPPIIQLLHVIVWIELERRVIAVILELRGLRLRRREDPILGMKRRG